MTHKDAIWARDIVRCQREDGSWGRFHTLSGPPAPANMTTEQALRRLERLGLTIQDAPIRRAVDYMRACLSGRLVPPDGREKVLDWDVFEKMMLAAWIRRFTQEDEQANEIAQTWADIMAEAVRGGAFRQEDYQSAYLRRFRRPPGRARYIAVSQFYMVSLTAGLVEPRAEGAAFDYFLSNDGGIYYVYSSRLDRLPDRFASLDASRYLGAIELLSGFSSRACRQKLGFVAEWLLAVRGEDGLWDMGANAKDGVYYPLSDSWRSARERRADCTERIEALLRRLGT